MRTYVLKIIRNKINSKLIQQAASVIKKGGLVAFPTETVYGLGANALNKKAVSKIFKAKGRPGDNPLIVHIASLSQLNELVKSVPKDAKVLMKAYWPGPLTLIFKKKPLVPSNVTAGLETVAVRMPSHPVALALIKSAGLPIAAPSANLSGSPSPTEGKHVIDDLMGRVPIIIDSGKTDIGLESTVLDITKKPFTILRPGGISFESLNTHVHVVLHSSLRGVKLNAKEIPESPGMKYRHYAPKAKLIVLRGEQHKVSHALHEMAKEFRESGQSVAVLASFGGNFGANHTIIRRNKTEFAKSIFSALREFDKQGASIILVAGVTEKGIGRAAMNRLEKAAVHRVIEL